MTVRAAGDTVVVVVLVVGGAVEDLEPGPGSSGAQPGMASTPMAATATRQVVQMRRRLVTVLLVTDFLVTVRFLELAGFRCRRMVDLRTWSRDQRGPTVLEPGESRVRTLSESVRSTGGTLDLDIGFIHPLSAPSTGRMIPHEGLHMPPQQSPIVDPAPSGLLQVEVTD